VLYKQVEKAAFDMLDVWHRGHYMRCYEMRAAAEKWEGDMRLGVDGGHGRHTGGWCQVGDRVLSWAAEEAVVNEGKRE